MTLEIGNKYLHIKIFIFVPKVDLAFKIDHMSDNISCYKLFIQKYSLSDLHINIMSIF